MPQKMLGPDLFAFVCRLQRVSGSWSTSTTRGAASRKSCEPRRCGPDTALLCVVTLCHSLISLILVAALMNLVLSRGTKMVQALVVRFLVLLSGTWERGPAVLLFFYNLAVPTGR